MWMNFSHFSVKSIFIGTLHELENYRLKQDPPRKLQLLRKNEYSQLPSNCWLSPVDISGKDTKRATIWKLVGGSTFSPINLSPLTSL